MEIILIIRIISNWWKFQSYFSCIFIPYFSSIYRELDNFCLKCYIESFDIDIILKQNKITVLSQILAKKSKIVSLTSSVMKNIVILLFPAWARFPVILICFNYFFNYYFFCINCFWISIKCLLFTLICSYHFLVFIKIIVM